MNRHEIKEVFDSEGTDKGNHGYSAFYSELVPPRRMLEIGLGRGSSMRSWRRIWGPEVDIYGMDVNVEEVKVPREDQHFHIFCMDATAETAPAGDFDLIIDDASHHLWDQVKIRRRHQPLLRSGGYYVIEDVFPAHVKDLMLKDWVLTITGPGWDDRLIWLRKP